MTYPFTYYLLTAPYTLVWKTLSLFRKKKQIVFYCDCYLDYVIFENVREHLPQMKIVAKNRQVKNELSSHGLDSVLWPVFPDVVIMARHAFHKFPSKGIVKIGTKHGVYHFKNLIRAEKFNAFSVYLFTSEYEVEEAKALGITCAQSGGYPKLDSYWFPDTDKKVEELRQKLGFNNGKPNILFTATWEGSGMSAVDKWCDRLSELTDEFNVMVTFHPFTNKKYFSKIKNTSGVVFLNDPKNYLYIKLADLMVGDTSSILAESCALDKPMVTFSVKESRRLTPNIVKLLQDISFRIDNFEELRSAIKHELDNPQQRSEQRQKYNKIMFDDLDGNHSKKAALKITNVLDEIMK